ncbi:MAG TPA: adenylate/guanylate cyclase domain-containing protein [Acidimicrobiales bacterium]|nr:adenylate/guanylate cyclase domain-containing protein [Acidimicrobiales bacterium]
MLEHLAAEGVSLDAMLAADARGELVTAGSDELLRGARPISAADVAAVAGIPLDQVLRIWLAIGLPIEQVDDKALPADAVETTLLFFEGSQVFGEEATLAFSRVMAAAASQVADAAVALFLGEVQPRLEASTASELEWAEANESAVATLEGVEKVMARLVREHVVRAVSRSRAARGRDPSEPRELELAVCFLDLVASTEWALRLPLSTASKALGRFETAAWDASVGRGGRLVKLIGDEAMIVAPTAVDACTIALAVLRTVSLDAGLPDARGAVGFGTVLFRDGDYFGPLVNVVARAVKEAAPGEVVVTAAVRDLVPAGAAFTVGPYAPHHLRGIDEPVALAPLR